MASCSIGTPNVGILKVDVGRAKVDNLHQCNGTKAWFGRRQPHFRGVAVSYQPKKASILHCGPTPETESATNSVDEKETKSSGLTRPLIPNSSEVESLVTEICDTATIAEFELKLDGFRLYLTRDITEKKKIQSLSASASTSALAPPPAPAPAPALVSSDLYGSSVPSTSLAISKPEPVSGVQSIIDRAADEGLKILLSPRVGFFRRSRTIKGKRAPPSCKEKQIVKEGQVICYIEQLGCELPLESDISGEVIKILREDGEPVGYADPLIAILPSFPGIKKLQ
ncbi:uncharacterized protein LOC126682731 [Mercurialis annua]|uniref:uncharacterized protein LOC126682731 n=1 Tax=Mercurialis annua TaxID=3986 RepID=UPI0021604662|nr:uncharacterized protein LOC126682731 [Mercurialis annua]